MLSKRFYNVLGVKYADVCWCKILNHKFLFQTTDAEATVNHTITADGVYLLGTVSMNIGNCTVPVDVIGVKHADGE